MSDDYDDQLNDLLEDIPVFEGENAVQQAAPSRQPSGLSKAAQRVAGVQHMTTLEDISAMELERWVEDTEGFSIAHLRELAVAVFCLKQEYADVLNRLMKMRVKPRSRSEFRTHGMFAPPEVVR